MSLLSLSIRLFLPALLRQHVKQGKLEVLQHKNLKLLGIDELAFKNILFQNNLRNTRSDQTNLTSDKSDYHRRS